MDWSDEEKNALKQLYESGYAYEEMVKVLRSRTPNGIRHQINAMVAMGEIERRNSLGGEVDYDLLSDMIKVRKI